MFITTIKLKLVGYHDVTLVAESGDLEVFRAGSSFQASQEIRDAAKRYIRKTL